MREQNYKIDSRMPLAKDPLKQSHFRWTLSTPVKSIGLSLLSIPGKKWMKPSITPNTPEWDWIKPKII